MLSYGVVQRLREIGLRIALGAAPRNVRGMVLKQVGWMAAIGVVVGVGLALLLGQAGRALFFGLTPTDPLVPAAAVLALTCRRARRRISGPRAARRTSILSLHCAAIEPRSKQLDSFEDKTMNATAP